MSSSGGNFLSTEDEESTQPSQEDNLKSEGDDLDVDEEEIHENIETAQESEAVYSRQPSHSPTPDQVEINPICPDADGYFVLKSSNFKQSRHSLHEFLKAHGSRTKVTVVGLFGKEKGYDTDKAVEIFDYLSQKDIFSLKSRDAEQDNEPQIEGFHDQANHRIYLNLRAHQTKNVKYVQLMLFLFHVCNLIICFQPSSVLDQSLVRLFQTLELARSKLANPLSKKLKALKLIPKWWHNFGRPCNPRLIFYFATCPLELRGDKGMAEIIKKTGKLSKHPPLKRLEFSLEDQIHRVFKRARITHTPNNLFNLSTKDNYVFVNNGGSNDTTIGESTQDALSYFLNQMDLEDHSLISGAGNAGEFMPTFYHQSVKKAYENNHQHSFGLFMSNHFDTMTQRGPDNVDGSKFTSELATYEQWYKASTVVLDVLFSPTRMGENVGESPLGKVQQILTNHIDIDVKFSEARCAKALPMAFAAYKEGLQSHYLAEVHNAKLLQAMSLYSMNARGFASQKYASLLLEECTNYWMAGRQMCEELSLTGSHCVNRKHLLNKSSRSSSSSEASMAVMPHRSAVTYISACNCGKKQSARDDPFNLLDANFTFYSEMEDECCRELERTLVPFQQTNVEDEIGTLANLVQANEGGKRQVSHVETVPYMPTKNNEQVLPAFPSWALTHIGTSTIYSHSSGVNQSGFISGTRNLHSWDVPLKKVNFKSLQDKFPNLAENATKRPGFNPSRKGLEMGITAKLFLGMEYECPRGHRFISGSPDKAVRTSKEGGGYGSKFVNADVPLYLGCPCRSSQGRLLVAQLMRIHVVTPKAPIKILFTPVVVPCPNGPEFHPGWKTPPEMPIHAYWVLRLPFIYCGKDGSHLPPKEVPAVNYAKLLKGCIQIIEEDIT